MNLEETTYWVGDLLPGEVTTSRRRVSQSFPEFTVAEIHLGGEDEAADAETVAATLDAARIEPLLVTEDGSDLRVEFITVTTGHGRAAADLVMAAATMISRDPIQLSPQPGLLLPKLGWHVDDTITAQHGLLVPPFLWEDGVPNVHEVNFGGRHGGGSQHEYTHPGRMTVFAQLVMLTEDEYRVAVDGGPGAVQQMLATSQANLNDVWR
ncbi:MAG: hypothetical protein ACTH2Y_09575 [Corynebacterium sp.]|uniref:hypothetical protein n=1 Tax=unclassified Corynebacterium TaxID=2624378 RepID=UPI002648548D|nr:hypothetical protein [Corynebacterium sp.]MDN5581383.1 hypothetical protein [Corynebacterium sp.]MDN5718657.1 hypothetical protein [Corynebacterium sp.]MDN6324739.1 hypothetical protein [Corynebacterium sp.]MDN6386087.1 hypothetical protein [Corynebacterium sp.]MDN6510961.1 hypothetical protein [Corynebacterium sp.]